MAVQKDILITRLRIEEAYIITIPYCKGIFEMNEVWLRSKMNPQLISNHSMYKDESGTWWWYNDNKLIQMPSSAKVKDFRYFYDAKSKPIYSYHMAGFNAEVEVLKTIYL